MFEVCIFIFYGLSCVRWYPYVFTVHLDPCWMQVQARTWKLIVYFQPCQVRKIMVPPLLPFYWLWKIGQISMMDPHVPFHQLAMKGGYSHNVDKTHDIVWFILCVYVYIYMYIKYIYTVYMNKYVYYLWTKHSDNMFYRVPDEIPWSEPAVLYLSLSGNGPRISHPWIIHFVMDFVSYPLVNV